MAEEDKGRLITEAELGELLQSLTVQADQENGKREGDGQPIILHFIYQEQLLLILEKMGYDPEPLIPYLIKKNHLVQRSKENEPLCYYIFTDAAQGEAF